MKAFQKWFIKNLLEKGGGILTGAGILGLLFTGASVTDKKAVVTLTDFLGFWMPIFLAAGLSGGWLVWFQHKKFPLNLVSFRLKPTWSLDQEIFYIVIDYQFRIIDFSPRARIAWWKDKFIRVGKTWFYEVPRKFPNTLEIEIYLEQEDKTIKLELKVKDEADQLELLQRYGLKDIRKLVPNLEQVAKKEIVEQKIGKIKEIRQGMLSGLLSDYTDLEQDTERITIEQTIAVNQDDVNLSGSSYQIRKATLE